MQTLLLEIPTVNVEDLAYQRAAIRECIQYGEHGQEIEHKHGRQVCFNCGGSL